MSDSPDNGTPDIGVASERRRPGWAEFRRSYPGLVATMAIALAALLAMDGWIIARRLRYAREIERLRGSMTLVERQRTDQIVSQEQNKLRVAIELMRRQAQLERALHLSVAVDSGVMYLEREGAQLREMAVQVGPERRVGTPPDTVRLAAPRGARTVARVFSENEPWEVPEWVFAERGIPAPPNRSIGGALGPVAILLDGGTVIYSTPTAGPLSDSAFVLPGAIRARAEDLRAILPNLNAGMRVYFY
ncbi:MAG: hypothetical protein WD825_07585 [Gemmatimonadaceae bacterium]